MISWTRLFKALWIDEKYVTVVGKPEWNSPFGKHRLRR